MGLNQRPKQPVVVGLPGGRGEGEGTRASRPVPGKGWLTFRKWPRPRPQTSAARNSLLADGVVSLYLFPHSLLCISAKNLPVISKLRRKVPPVLAAVSKCFSLYRNDLTRTKGSSGASSPAKTQSAMCHRWRQVFRGSPTANDQGKTSLNFST